MRACLVWALVLCCLPGCASRGETKARLTALEQAVEELRVQEARLALLEDRVNGLSADVGHLRGAGASVRPDSAPAKAEPRVVEPRKAATAPARRPPARGQAKDTPHDAGAALAPSRPASGEQAEYTRALALLEAGKAGEARERFTAFLAEHPDASLAPNAGYWLGESEYSLKHYDNAILAFKRVVARYPKHPKAAASMLKTAYAYERLGDKENARFYLNALLEDFPGSEPAVLARKKLAALR